MNILRYEEQAADIYEKLKTTPRTGWVMRGVPNPESVYDHTVSLVQLATNLATSFALTDTELDELTLILEVHDWAEALTGDKVILDENPEDYAAKKAEKHAREVEAMHTLCSNQPFGPTALAAWGKYEAAVDPLAKLAKQLDKYQAVELALKYEQKHNIALFEEFDVYSKKHITHLVLIEKLEQLRTRHKKEENTK